MPTLSRLLLRAALGRGVCEREEWRNPKGHSCEASVRKALPRLAAALILPLLRSLEELGEVRLR